MRLQQVKGGGGGGGGVAPHHLTNSQCFGTDMVEFTCLSLKFTVPNFHVIH